MPVMITGDNAQTAVCVAKRAGLVDSDCVIVLGEVAKQVRSSLV